MPETADGITNVNDRVNTKTQNLVLKQVHKNVSKMEESKLYYGYLEEYFGLSWKTCIQRVKKGSLGVYLHCDRQNNEKEWSVDTEYEIHVLHPNGQSVCRTGSSRYDKKNGTWGWDDFMTWETMKKEYLVNDELVVEIRVNIFKMTGIEIYLQRFDDEECSDVALVVGGEKFHVSRLYLASQSSYFKSMFLGKFNESEKAEIELTGIDGYDLQKYLEMLYGEDALNEETVGGILQLADMYDTKKLLGKCEEYLLEVSRKTLKEKLELSVRYNLDELKKKCMSEIKTVNDVRSVIPEKVGDMDKSILADLFEKTLALAK
ncbi:unnamed protein product [Caenorhabditis brenneri]